MDRLGPYHLHDVIGRGGMGMVYRAHDSAFDREVAVKVVSPTFASVEGFRERFQGEIHSLEKLRHPHIVELYGYGEEHGHLFYAMELVKGGSLQQELSSGCRFTWRDVVRYAIQICGALKHAHDSGIIHRDLKPANLLLDDQGQIKLSDFGVAKLFGESQRTMAGSIVGTADFMSPEQAEGLPVTARSDLYSLGSVMYALLTGFPPFRGSSVPEVVHKVRYEPPIPVRRHVPDVPAPLESLIDQLLAKDPSRRIPTPLALSKRLQAIEQGLTVVGRPSESSLMTRHNLPSAAYLSDSETLVVPPEEEEGEVGPATQSIPVAGVSLGRRGTSEDPSIATDAASVRPMRRFTLVDDEYRRQIQATEPESTWMTVVRMLLLALMLAVVGWGFWHVARPRTADQLYQRMKSTEEQSTSAAALLLDTQRREFLQRFPHDPRAESIRQSIADAELDRLERSLLARDATDRSRTLVIEDWMRQAYRCRESDPTQAVRILNAIVALYADPKSLSSRERQCLALAQRTLQRMQADIDERAEVHQSRIRSWLQRARRSSAEERAAICHSILDLYASEAWAAPYLAEAKALLSEPVVKPVDTLSGGNSRPAE